MAVATDTRAVGEAAGIAIGGTVGLDAMFGDHVYWTNLGTDTIGRDEDLAVLFEQWADPVAAQMAAFTSREVRLSRDRD